MREETILNAINDLDSINCMIQDIHESIYQDTPNYWTRFEHQAAIAAMQGILSNANHALWWDRKNNAEGIAMSASAIAHALVEKMKEADR